MSCAEFDAIQWHRVIVKRLTACLGVAAKRYRRVSSSTDRSWSFVPCLNLQPKGHNALEGPESMLPLACLPSCASVSL